MSLSAISVYRGGSLGDVLPLSRALKAAYVKHGMEYRLGRFQNGPNAGDWLVIVHYADQDAYDRAHLAMQADSEIQRIFVEIAKFAKRISREVIDNVDLS